MNIEDIKKKLKHDLLYEVKDFYTQINTVCDKYSLIYDNIDHESVIHDKESQVLDKIRKYIIYYRQILTYLSMLIDDLHNSIQMKDSLILSYENEKNSIMDIIGEKIIINKDQAYKRFQKLTKIYTKIQEKIFILYIR